VTTAGIELREPTPDHAAVVALDVEHPSPIS